MTTESRIEALLTEATVGLSGVSVVPTPTEEEASSKKWVIASMIKICTPNEEVWIRVEDLRTMLSFEVSQHDLPDNTEAPMYIAHGRLADEPKGHIICVWVPSGTKQRPYDPDTPEAQAYRAVLKSVAEYLVEPEARKRKREEEDRNTEAKAKRKCIADRISRRINNVYEEELQGLSDGEKCAIRLGVLMEIHF